MMKMEMFRAIVDESARWHPELRLFNFGEPLLHPELGEMVGYAHGKGLVANVQTNGLLLDESRIVLLLRAGIGYIGVSVNGLTESEYENIRPGCRLEDIKQNLRLLRTASRRLGKRVHVHLNAQIMADERKDRREDIDCYVRYWEGIPDTLSVSGISLFDRVTVMRGGARETVDQARLPRKTPAAVACSEPFDRLVVKWDGRVTPCCADYDAQLVLGQFGLRTLEEIWQGDTLADLRLTVSAGRYDSSPLCRSCPKLYSSEFTLLFQKNEHAHPLK